MKDYLMAIDAGTGSVRAIILTLRGNKSPLVKGSGHINHLLMLRAP